MAAVLWFIGAMLLAGGELLAGELFLLMLAGGAVAGGVTAIFAPEFIPLQVLIFAVTSLLLVKSVRPLLKRRLMASIPDPDLLLTRVIGAPARTLTDVSELRGQAKVNGEIWTARVHEDAPSIPAGTDVRVAEVRGATIYIERE